MEIAKKANLAVVLPIVLVATHILPTINKSFQDGPTLKGGEKIRLIADDGKVYSGKGILRYLSDLANNDSNLSEELVHCVCSYRSVQNSSS